jgi:RNA polymerase sigma factor (sigma-70 family)
MSGSPSPAERGGSSNPPSPEPSAPPSPFVRSRARVVGPARTVPVEGGDWFASVVRQYEQPLVLFAARITRDLERARDVVQEAFLKLTLAERRDVEPHVAEWLYTVCRNKSLDIRRKEKRIAPLAEGSLERETATDTPPAEVMERNETADEALRLMGRLPENQQEVIRLRFQHGMSYQQISEVTGLSVSNVGFLLHTGLKTLRERMNRKQ